MLGGEAAAAEGPLSLGNADACNSSLDALPGGNGGSAPRSYNLLRHDYDPALVIVFG
jgi:hypothetical protein